MVTFKPFIPSLKCQLLFQSGRVRIVHTLHPGHSLQIFYENRTVKSYAQAFYQLIHTWLLTHYGDATDFNVYIFR